MKRIYLFSTLNIREIEKASECSVCGRMFAVVRIKKVSEQSGGESHYSGHLDGPDGIVDFGCPYCPRVGDEVLIKETSGTKKEGVSGKTGLVVGPVTDNKISVLLRKPVLVFRVGRRKSIIVGASEVIVKKRG